MKSEIMVRIKGIDIFNIKKNEKIVKKLKEVLLKLEIPEDKIIVQFYEAVIDPFGHEYLSNGVNSYESY